MELTDVNTKAAAAGTQEAIDAAKKKLEDGSLHVFDTSAFTVNGKKLDSYKADVDTDGLNIFCIGQMYHFLSTADTAYCTPPARRKTGQGNTASV